MRGSGQPLGRLVPVTEIPVSRDALGEAGCSGAPWPESVPFLLPPTSGHGGISLGRELLGGWVFCRDGGR